MKRFALILLMAVLFSINIQAEIGSGRCGDNVYWTLNDDGLLTISGSGPMYDYNSYNTPFVNYWGKIKQCNIQDSISSIGSYVFYLCYRMTSISISESVTSIGNWAFYGCSSLNSITIPDSVTSIGESTFQSCSSLSSITIGSGVIYIGNEAFHNCNSLSSITVDNNNTVYDSRNNCNAIIEKSSNSLIFGCYSTIIPSTVTSIGLGAFYGCESLSSVIVPNSITSIGNYAFYGCTSLTSITCLSETPPSLGYSVFDQIPYTEVTLYVPWGCSANYSWGFSNIKEIFVNEPHGNCGENSLWCLSEDSVLTISGDGEMWEGGACSFGKYGNIVKEIQIGEDITRIGSSVFRGCYRVDSVLIPNSVISIGSWAFDSCSCLNSVTIGSSVEVIDGRAFTDCPNLTSVTCLAEAPPTLTRLYSGWTYYGAFDDNTLSRGILYVPWGYKDMYSSWVNYNRGYISTFSTIIEVYELSLPQGSCGDDISWILSRDSVLTITGTGKMYESYSFSRYRNIIKEINIGNEITSIASGAFGNCKAVSSIKIPEGVTSIGNQSFEGCSSLASITIPDSVISIGYWAFSNCTSLSSVTIGSGVTSIEVGTFGYCSSLSSVTIPNSITSIGDKAFYGCSSLTSVIIPDSVVNIGNHAFYDCYKLSSATIGKSVNTIGSHAFANCYELSSLTCLVETPPSIVEGWIFYNAPLASGTLYVPWGCTNDYKSWGWWFIKEIFVKEPQGTCGDNLSFVLSKDSVLTITGSGQMFNNESNSFERFGQIIREVNIEEGVTSIGSYAFRNCSLLSSFTPPSSLLSIGERAFQNCSSMTAVTLPNTVTSIGDYAFFGCTGVLNIDCDIPDGRLGGYNVYGPFVYSKFDKINLSNSVTKIGAYSFCLNDKIQSLVIPNNVTSVGDGAFLECSLKSLTIGSGVLSIGEKAFNNKPIKTIWFPNSAPAGYENAVGTVNYVANDQYGNIQNKRVYKYLSSMFQDKGVKYAIISPSERTCDVIDCEYDGQFADVNIKDTVTYKGVTLNVLSINDYSFYKNGYVKSITLSNNGNIGEYAFSRNNMVESVNVSNNGYIGYNAFSQNDSTKTVILSNNGNIGEYAFYKNKSIESVTVSNNGDIGVYAFSQNDSIKNVVLSNKGNIGAHAFEGSYSIESVRLSNTGYVGDCAFIGCGELVDLTLSEGITALGDEAFRGCSKLESVIIPNSVKSIGKNCFAYNESLSEASIGNGTKLLSESAFQNCVSLANVTIGDSVGNIEASVFQNCKSLAAISIPSSVNALGNNVFAGCTSLSSVVIADRDSVLTIGSNNGSNPFFIDCPLDSVYIGGKILYETSLNSGYSPFYRNTSLRSVTVTDKEEAIYDNEFYGCTGLKNVKIGNGVQKIGDWAFSGCSALEYFAFGTGLKSIGKESFSDCIGLTALVSCAEVPPVCDSQALEDINKWECTLYVPDVSLNAYKEAEQWMDFFFIDVNQDYVSSVQSQSIDDVDNDEVIYNMSGQRIHNLQKGLNIVNGKKVLVR